MVLRPPELGAHRKRDLAGTGLREVVAGDLAAGVGRRLDEVGAPRELDLADPRLLAELAPCGLEGILALFDLALGEVPVPEGAKQQEPGAVLSEPHGNDSRGKASAPAPASSPLHGGATRHEAPSR